MSELDYDVAIVGAGPTGLTVANLLGAAGIRTLLVERNPTTVQAPRAVSIDDESLRSLQATGLIAEVLADVALDYGSHYFTSKGEIFLKVEPATREFGHPRRNAFLQPSLEATLRSGLSRHASVTAWFETDCERVTEADDHVSLSLRDKSGEAREVRVAYLVGSDGGRSAIRKTIGATLGGATYQQRWLIVDLADTQEQFRQTRVLCNPDRPTICLPGPHGTRRYEFMLHDNETDEIAQSDDFVTALLAAHGPDAEATRVRQQVYTFHARMVDRWSTARIFLAGDAAHLTPPFAGQGMNSGLRDAHNLAWKLIAVLLGQLGAQLLRSYEAERPKHAWALIQLAVQMGRIMMPTSHAQAWLVQTLFRLARQVPRVQAYFAEMRYKPKPFYQQGFFHSATLPHLVGRMVPQAVLELADRSQRLMDDVLGSGFAVIAYGRQAQTHASLLDTAALGLGSIVSLAITPRHWNPLRDQPQITAGRDVEGRMARYDGLHGTLFLLLRPDRYVAVARQVTTAQEATEFTREVSLLVAATR